MTVSGKLLGCCCLVAWLSTALPASAAEHAWVRMPADDFRSHSVLRPDAILHPVTFGLTVGQRDQLHALTNGAVDFRSIYRVQLQDSARNVSAASQLQQLSGFMGMVPTPLSPLAGFQTVLDGNGERAAADPDLANAWWLEELGVVKAWQMATGKGITIADCDSGYHTEEPDLAPNLVLEERRDFSDMTRPTVVTDGAFVFHGTAVAAIMAGVRDGEGVNGIAYDAKVVPLQNYNYDRSLDNSDKEEATARCVLYALRLPSVRIILVENQTPTGSSETFAGTRDAIRLAIKSGITVVSAAGNNSLELQSEATDDSGSIIVGALRRSGRRSIFTNWGSRVTVGAYGEEIRTLYGPGGQIETFGGTTAAAAQVAAAVALMLEVNPRLTPQQVRKILVATRRVINDNASVGGLIDIDAAVRSAAEAPFDAPAWDRQQQMMRSVRALLAD